MLWFMRVNKLHDDHKIFLNPFLFIKQPFFIIRYLICSLINMISELIYEL